MQAVFVNSEDMPIKTEHVCYFTTNEESGDISLCEVVYEHYPHPDAPQDAIIKLTTTKHICTHSRTSQRGAQLVLMEASQESMIAYAKTISSRI